MVRYRLPCTVTVGVPGAQDTGDYREIIHCFLALAGAVSYKYKYRYCKSIHCFLLLLHWFVLHRWQKILGGKKARNPLCLGGKFPW